MSFKSALSEALRRRTWNRLDIIMFGLLVSCSVYFFVLSSLLRSLLLLFRIVYHLFSAGSSFALDARLLLTSSLQALEREHEREHDRKRQREDVFDFPPPKRVFPLPCVPAPPFRAVFDPRPPSPPPRRSRSNVFSLPASFPVPFPVRDRDGFFSNEFAAPPEHYDFLPADSTDYEPNGRFEYLRSECTEYEFGGRFDFLPAERFDEA
jgi:hypothetical protein